MFWLKSPSLRDGGLSERGVKMSVILTNGQSFSDIAAQYTLAVEYGPAIANYNNMTGEDIAGKKYRIEIPDTWMLPQYSGKQIDLRGTMTNGTPGGVMGVPWFIWAGVAVAALMLVK